ncbi:MAG TPA: hypothetical protein PLU62_11705 [Ignavibacteriales bacterium]|nr:hypothetical protein [Ignavibacteriales bacterium]
MKLITDKEIKELNISNSDIIRWVTQSFMDKSRCLLPHKIVKNLIMEMAFIIRCQL